MPYRRPNPQGHARLTRAPRQYNALLDTLAQEYNKQDKSRFYVCRRYINEAKLSCVASLIDQTTIEN